MKQGQRTVESGLFRWSSGLAILALLAALPAGVVLAEDPICQPLLVERQRYGFVASYSSWPQRYDLAQLRAGWAVDFVINEAAASGLDRALVIRVRTGYTVDPQYLGPIVEANPGAMWLIGNEPDCIWQDDVLPAEYARIYHNLYTFIKNLDQTSLVAAGGIVQPTPARLDYLDQVLAVYQARYGRAMPVDMWHIHNAILNEIQGEFGADIPPGVDPALGLRREIDDNDDVNLFKGQIWAFRQWMAAQGYKGYPLIVTEYGILMPQEYGFTEERVNDFMSATFAFMGSTIDPTLGDPADGYRLVQRWAWFSLDAPRWEDDPTGFNGNLFDRETTEITANGLHYASHTVSFAPLAYVDLGVAAWDLPAMPFPIGDTQQIGYSLRVRLTNGGTEGSGPFGVRLSYDGPVSGTLYEPVADLPAGSSQWVEFTLQDLGIGSYALSLEVDADDQVPEPGECDNGATRTIVVPKARVTLPLVQSRHEEVTPLERKGEFSADPSHADSPPIPRQEPGADALVSLDYTVKRRPAETTVSRSPAPRASDMPGFEEFPLPNGSAYPAQIALDGQGNVWITERDGNRVSRFEPQTKTWRPYDLPTPGSQPWGLALDGRGNVWFAETGANKIGKLEINSGAISEYAIPTAGSEPWDVAVDGGGVVWFTLKSANKIGKLNPATGVVTEYAVLTPNAQPTGIAADTYYVWFTEAAANKLGRLKKVDGRVAEIGLPTPNSNPQEIVLDNARDPWLTEMDGNKLAVFRVSTQAWFREVPVHTPGSEPYGIAANADGMIWFTARATNRLGFYMGHTPPYEYPLPTPDSLPTGIAVDAEGCVWYTAPGSNRIGQFCRPPHHTLHLPLVAKKLATR